MVTEPNKKTEVMSDQSINDTLISHAEDIATLIQAQTTSTNNMESLRKSVERGFDDMRTESKEIRKDIGAVRESKNKSLWPVVIAIATIIVGMGAVAVAMSVLVLNPIGISLASSAESISKNQDSIHKSELKLVEVAKDIQAIKNTEDHRAKIDFQRYTATIGDDGRPWYRDTHSSPYGATDK